MPKRNARHLAFATVKTYAFLMAFCDEGDGDDKDAPRRQSRDQQNKNESFSIFIVMVMVTAFKIPEKKDVPRNMWTHFPAQCVAVFLSLKMTHQQAKFFFLLKYV